eukprot:jgi/Botrbrau1/5790/Bobra.0155s0013.1
MEALEHTVRREEISTTRVLHTISGPHMQTVHQMSSIRGSYSGGGSASYPHFTKKIPQTSVAPTYKLTLPSDFINQYARHLVDQDFDMYDENGKKFEVSIQPRRNKDKYEYTLYKWKEFAVEHCVQQEDKLTIEFTADMFTLKAYITRKGAGRDRVYHHSMGPAAHPNLSLPINVGHRVYHGMSSPQGASMSTQQDDGSPASVRTGPPAILHHNMDQSEISFPERASHMHHPVSWLQGVYMRQPMAHVPPVPLSSRSSFTPNLFQTAGSGGVTSVGGAFQPLTSPPRLLNGASYRHLLESGRDLVGPRRCARSPQGGPPEVLRVIMMGAPRGATGGAARTNLIPPTPAMTGRDGLPLTTLGSGRQCHVGGRHRQWRATCYPQ